MKFPNLIQNHNRLALWIGPLLMAFSAVLQAQTPVPAQLPLLSRAGAGVQPNIMVLMDDSGSMAFRHMPEYVFASDTFATTNPVQSNTVRWDLTDSYQTGVNFRGTVPGIQNPPNYVLAALRSPDTNTVFYNPEIRYQPWFNDDGATRRPDSPVTTAYLNPPLKRRTATSTTSKTIATGSQTFTLAQTGKSFQVGQNVVISSTAAPTTQWMYGSITAFNSGSGSITVNVTEKAGAGTLASWTFVQSPKIDLTAVIPNGTFTAGTFVPGVTYTIVTKGTTNFTLIGAANSNVGTVFTATGVGTGTGTASTGTMAGGTGGWCFANAGITGTGTGAGGGCQAPTTAFMHDRGLYFRLTKTGSTYNNLTVIGNYTAYSINDAATSYPKVAARTDCSGAVGATGCTKAEERQNFANWWTYYRTRNLMARGSFMEAFAADPATVTAGAFVTNAKYRIQTVGTTSFTSIGASANTVGTVFTATGAGSGTGTAIPVTYRMGFGRINRGATTVDTVATTAIEDDSGYGSGGLRDYTHTRRENLFLWLEDLPASGSTPLVPAFEAIGEYYRRTDNRGPWTDDPSGAVANVVANNKTCRRSYQIAMTDGYWNTTAGSKGNADATATGPITGVGTSYPGYTPVNPYKDNTANTMADSAMYYWVNDLQPAMDNKVKPIGTNISFWQNMTTFTVSMGVRGNLDPKTDLPALISGTKTWPPAGTGQTTNNVDDLWHAAVNSRGEYFSVKDPKQLADSVKSILSTATGDDKPTAGVATASTTLTTSNYKYIPEFQTQGWSGDVKAIKLVNLTISSTEAWKASDHVPAWASRNIVTWDTGLGTPAAVAFDWAALSGSNQAALGSVAATYTTGFTDFLRGSHAKEKTYLQPSEPFRNRIDKNNNPFVLGDFMNANPVAVLDGFDGSYGSLNLGTTGSSTNPSYPEFMTAKRGRTSVLFAGSNDGMLHGFKDSRSSTPAADDGKEVFAYIPRAVYPNLYKLADPAYGTATLPHQYFVDGPLREADAYVKAPGASSATWRNYLLGTLGAGGRAVYALDVTDLAGLGASSVRWEISDANDPDLGYVLSPIKVGVLDNGRWVAIFGNGFSSTNGNSILFVVDLEKAADNDASAIQKLVVDSSGSNGLGGVTLIHDADGKVTTVYAGDLKGNLWKLDYSASSPSNFVVSGGSAMFVATDGSGTRQPITASPAVYNSTQAAGGKIVVFGTGKLFATADATDTSMQTAYAVWDKPADSLPRPLGRSDLTARTLTSFAGTGAAASTTFYNITETAAIDWATSRGWRLDIGTSLTGGRVIYPALVVGFDTALISTVAPAQGVLGVCDSLTGTGLNLLMPVQGGLTPSSKTFDTNGDGSINSLDVAAIAYSTPADGVDVVVRSSSVSGEDGINDPGGGGHEGDCTGATCSAGGECVASPLCPANTCLSSIQSATAGITICVPTGAPSTRVYDRVWRRIINPPIH